jgi:hypothetical protein
MKLSTVGILAASSLAVIALSVLIGLASAIAPTGVARLIPILAMTLTIIYAGYSRNERPIPTWLSKYWVQASIVILSCWPTYIFFSIGNLPTIDPRKLLALFTVGSLIYLLVSKSFFLSQATGANSKASRTTVFIITAYLTLRALSCIVSESPISSFTFILWEFISYYSIFFLALGVNDKNLTQSRIYTVLLWVGFAITIFSTLEKIAGSNPLTSLAPRNERFSEFALAMSIARMRDGFFRAQGTFEHPLLLAEFASITSCFGLAALAFSRTFKAKSVGSAILLLSITSIWASDSRAAYVATASGAGLIFLLVLFRPSSKEFSHRSIAGFKRRKAMFLVALATSVAIAVPLAYAFAQGNTRDQQTSSQARVAMLELGIPHILENPLLGQGPVIGREKAAIKTGAGVSTLDNYLLAIALESGLPCLFLFIAMLTYVGWQAILLLLAGPSKNAPFLAGTVGALVAFLVMRTILWMPYNLSLILLLLVGVLQARESADTSAES